VISEGERGMNEDGRNADTKKDGTVMVDISGVSIDAKMMNTILIIIVCRVHIIISHNTLSERMKTDKKFCTSMM